MQALSLEELKNLLRKGSVHFGFKKTNGEIRKALGTLDFSIIPQESLPKGGKAPNGVMGFFDIEKSEWRGISCQSEVWLE